MESAQGCLSLAVPPSAHSIAFSPSTGKTAKQNRAERRWEEDISIPQSSAWDMSSHPVIQSPQQRIATLYTKCIWKPPIFCQQKSGGEDQKEPKHQLCYEDSAHRPQQKMSCSLCLCRML